MKSSVSRRALPLLLAVCLLLWPLGGAVEWAPGLAGDLNRDQKIDAADALAVLQHCVELVTLSAEQQNFSDLNGDGVVNASDALLILQYSVSLIEEFSHSKEDTRMALPWLDANAVYARHSEAIDPGAIRTTYQYGGWYSPTVDLPMDAIMVYINSSNNVDTIPGWQATGKEIWVMLPAYRDGDEYFGLYPDRADTEREQNADGSFGGVMPNENYTEYKWSTVERCIDAGARAVVLEEPITGFGGVYSDYFKTEWQEYYSTPWSDPNDSAEARYRASRLVEHLAVEMFRTIGERIKQKDPTVPFYIANHNAYRAIGDFTCVNSAILELDCVDGIINQTWSNTSLLSKPYAGTSVCRPFQNNYIEYGNAVAVAGEKTLFTLSDPMADYADEDYEKYITLWQEQLAAQLLHPEIHHFQNSIWTGRHFGEAVPAAFSTTQLSVFQAMNDLSGKESTLYAGTGGIALAMSDSMTWLTGVDGAITTSSAREGMYGLSLPLVERGIPLASVCLDRLHSAAQLEQVKILLWPIDVVHPQSQEALQIVADWVRAGGVLIEVGGINAYENLSGEWWGERSPLERLLSLLELDNLSRTPFQDVAMLEWCGPRGYGQHIGGLLPYQQSMNAYCWEGAGSPIVSSNLGDTLGLDVAAGEGRLLLCGLPSAYFSVAAEGPGALRDLVEYATRYTDVLYQESGAMVIRRGDYLIAHALEQEQTITGQFVDLFDAKLPLISSKQVEQNASAMLLDVSSKLEGDTPRLLHTGGTLSAPAQESAEQTRFAISVPVGAAGSTRLAGNGRTMESISVTLSGQPYEQYETVWDEATGTLLLSLEGNGKPVDITVEWSAQ